MDASEEFLKHAAECKRMARFARELQDKVTWRQMSERWLRCAEWSEKEARAARARPTKQAYGITIAIRPYLKFTDAKAQVSQPDVAGSRSVPAQKFPKRFLERVRGNSKLPKSGHVGR